MSRPALSSDEVDEFRDRASAAALELVEAQGVANLTLRRLAAKLGCSYATPYRYYRDKAALVDAVRGRAFDRLGAHFEAAFASGEPPSGAHYLKFAFENPEAFEVMFSLEQDFVSDETRAAEARAWKACARPFHDAVEAGFLEGDPELIAHVAWSALHGLASLALAGKLHHGKSVEQVLVGFGAIIDGFRPGAVTGRKPWLG